MNGNIAHLATLYTNTDVERNVHTLYGTGIFTLRRKLVRSLDSMLVVGYYPVRISGGLLGILTIVFHDFPQYLQANAIITS
jgi:hypothetical protein